MAGLNPRFVGGGEQASGAPNRYCASGPKDHFPPLALRRPMSVLKNGVRQIILREDMDRPYQTGDEPPRWFREHYPMVDVYECRHCGAVVARE